MGAGFAKLLLAGRRGEPETRVTDAPRLPRSLRIDAQAPDAYAYGRVCARRGARRGCDAGPRAVSVVRAALRSGADLIRLVAIRDGPGLFLRISPAISHS
jgi:hypothetical protein